MATKGLYIVVLRLNRDPGVADGELVRALSDWKQLKDGSRHPPKWGRAGTPATLVGFLRLLLTTEDRKPGIPSNFVFSVLGDQINVCAIFIAEAGRTPLIAQALSSMAFGLKPGSYLDVARRKTTAKDISVCVSHRRFEIVRNGDGEPEVEEVRVDD